MGIADGIMKKVMGQAAQAAQAASTTATEVAKDVVPGGGLLSKVASMEKQAIAANHANDIMKNDVKPGAVGTIRKIVGFVPDIAGDALNVATLGGFGHIRNVYNKVTSGVSLDFKNAKAMLKQNEKMTIKERTEALLPDIPTEATSEEMEIQ